MVEPNEPSTTERWLPLAMLAIAVGIGLVLYFKGGNPLDNVKILAGYLSLIMVFSLGLTILYAIATGKINLEFLLSESDGHASMSRFQLMIFTFVIALSIVMMVVSSTPPAFPAIPNEVLILLGISASTYAVSKGIHKSAETDQAEIDAAARPPADKPEQAKSKGAGE